MQAVLLFVCGVSAPSPCFQELHNGELLIIQCNCSTPLIYNFVCNRRLLLFTSFHFQVERVVKESNVGEHYNVGRYTHLSGTAMLMTNTYTLGALLIARPSYIN